MSEAKYVERELVFSAEDRSGSIAPWTRYTVTVWGWPDTAFREPKQLRTVYMGRDKATAELAFENEKKRSPHLTAKK